MFLRDFLDCFAYILSDKKMKFLSSKSHVYNFLPWSHLTIHINPWALDYPQQDLLATYGSLACWPRSWPHLLLLLRVYIFFVCVDMRVFVCGNEHNKQNLNKVFLSFTVVFNLLHTLDQLKIITNETRFKSNSN